MPYILLLRPHNWIKNFFVFVPLFFAHELFEPAHLALSAYAFAAFCAISSCVYVINDVVDRENDRRHPTKQRRPIASGVVDPTTAVLMAGALLLVACAISFFYVPQLMPIIAVYFVANIAYSLYFKRVAIIDILMVSGFYLLRVSAGALAIGVPVSGWLLLATIFVSLFLITAKRKAELVHGDTRAVLAHYTPDFLHTVMLLALALLVVVYSIYTVTVVASHAAVYSVFFVLLGVLRYLHVASRNTDAEQPERLIFSDTWIFVSAVGWIVFMYYVLY